jgi:hypothetical protein
MIEVVLVAAAMALAACSDAPPPSTPTPVTPVCTSVFPLGPTSSTFPADGGQDAIFFGAFPEICTFKAVSNAPFISVISVQTSASKGGGRPVVLNIAPNPASSPRTGTVTVADTFVHTYNQERDQLAIALSLWDPARLSGPTTECVHRGSTALPTTCSVTATVTANGGSPIVSYAWTLTYYADGRFKTFSQTGPNPEISFTGTCGEVPGSPSETTFYLSVELTVTDSSGSTVALKSGQRGQPDFDVRPVTCGS